MNRLVNQPAGFPVPCLQWLFAGIILVATRSYCFGGDTNVQLHQDSTKSKILGVGEQLLRTRGYNGFSYADIADAVGTTKANIHHYYRTKEDLGCALINMTMARMAEFIKNDAGASTLEQLRRYLDVFQQSIAGDLVCLCGMLMAEDEALPPLMREANTKFIDYQINWLEQTLESGRKSGELNFEGHPRDQAMEVFSAVHGGHVIAKVRKDHDGFRAAMKRLLSRLQTG